MGAPDKVQPKLFYFIRFANYWQGHRNSMTPITAGLCVQTNLFWREMKINKMYTET